MGKKDSKITEEMPLANPQGKTVEELVEIAQTLQLQQNQHQEKANQHQEKSNQYQTAANQELKMVTKAQGGLEVILQLIPKERVEEMIQAEKNGNHKMDEHVESSS